MFKLSQRLLLSLVLSTSAVQAAPATMPLLKIIARSPTTPTNSYLDSCTLNIKGQLLIEHSVYLFPSGPSLISKETRLIQLNTKDIKSVIDQAANGSVTGMDLIGGATYKYYAYQKQADGSVKEVFLANQNGIGRVNDSPSVEPLSRFIDRLCGTLVTPTQP